MSFKIIDENCEDLYILFGSVGIGDCFENKDGAIYRKINKGSAIQLNSGIHELAGFKITNFFNSHNVKPIDIELVIKR